jgi:hypothetical protein
MRVISHPKVITMVEEAVLSHKTRIAAAVAGAAIESALVAFDEWYFHHVPFRPAPVPL